MVDTWLLAGALICFVLTAFGVTSRVNLMGAGLAFCVLSVLF